MMGDPPSINFGMVSKLELDSDSGYDARNIPEIRPMIMGIVNR